jgi:4-amino-4-deoxy-L-arabinose transferase-like glycosyltransferase
MKGTLDAYRPWFLVVIAAAVGVLYFTGLGYSPVYLLNDEVHTATHAYALATTARSASGDLLPVYFTEPEFPPGRDPFVIYATALVLKLLPLSEMSLRLSTAAAGVAGMVVIYFAASLLFGSRRAGIAAALLLGLTPAYFIHSRMAISTLWPIPFILGWIYFLARYDGTKQPRDLFAGCLLLGASCFAYLGTASVAPLFLAGTIVWMYAIGERRPRCYACAVAGFAAPFMLLMYAQIQQPTRYADLVRYYAEEAAAQTAAGAGIPSSHALGNFVAWQKRVSTYWNYFNPNLLFVSGDSSPRYSTSRSGVFLLPLAVLIPLGFGGILSRSRQRSLGWLLIACFFVTPLFSSLQADVQIKRVLPLVPFGVLLAVAGLERAVDDSRRWMRSIAVASMVLVALQFTVFAADYFGGYRLRSGFYRNGNLPDAMTRTIAEARQGDRKIFLSSDIPNIHIYWPLYARMQHAEALLDRASIVDSNRGRSPDIPPGALLLGGADEVPVALLVSGAWHLVARIWELDGTTLYAVYQRN